ncbi:MAG: hypothetical protein ACYCWW_00940 [Deltaproteobacteria bacterium]
MPKLIRIKPYDPKRGHLVRRYTAFSIRLEESRGWYRVADDVAEYLAKVHQSPHDEDSPLVFDVCTEAEAHALEEAERKKAEERAKAAEPNVATPYDLTTSDLASHGGAARPEAIAAAPAPVPAPELPVSLSPPPAAPAVAPAVPGPAPVPKASRK